MDTFSKRPKRKVVRVDETTENEGPLWKVTLECEHYILLSKRKWKYPPSGSFLCHICKSQKGKS